MSVLSDAEAALDPDVLHSPEIFRGIIVNLLTMIKLQTPPPGTPGPILKEALDIIWGDREKTYGAPQFNLETIAEFWNIWLKRRHNVLVALMPEDVAHMMVLLKMARLLNDPFHRDSLTDGAGYLGLVDRISPQQQEGAASAYKVEV